MMPSDKKKIIVIGGSGETGKRIVQHLSQAYPHITIASAARKEQPQIHLPNVEAMHFDVDKPDQARKLLIGFQLAIIVLGPTDKFGATVHQMCLEANVDIIDINDSLKVADEIHLLHDEAKSKTLKVFTGMGFCPGISTLLLMQLADKNTSPTADYQCRFYMGAAYGGGETSPYAMLASFKNTITQLIDGIRQEQNTPWDDEHCTFQFPSQTKPLDLIPFSSPEVSGLALNRTCSNNPIDTLDTRYHIQFLPKGMAKLLARFNLSQRTKDYFARKFYASGQSMKAKKKSDPDTTLWVYPNGHPEKGLLIHGVISSYDLTALMTCAVADAWLAGDLSHYNGVYATEHLEQFTRQRLLNTLSKWGIQSKEADPTNLMIADIHFGWCETPCKEVNKLRNYALNWYSFTHPHPKMEALQKRSLTGSDIWENLKKKQSHLAFAKFVARTLLRWKRHHKSLAAYRSGKNIDDTAKWQAITKDMSMFTSGYSEARDILGQTLAYELYRQMFLDTGKMEMRWLWPKPDTFSTFDDPAQSIIEYWLAFMQNYARLGVFKLTIEQTDNWLKCQINECAYAKMFTELGCIELSNLVREMECEALKFIASKSNLHINWIIGSKGSSEIFLQKKIPKINTGSETKGG